MHSTSVAEAVAHARVELPGPLDLPASLAGLGRWGDDGTDRWDGMRLLRTVRLDGIGPVAYRADVTGTLDRPALRVSVDAPDALPAIVDAVGTGFVLGGAELDALAACDPVVAAVARSFRGVRPVLHPDPLTALIRSISAQQINLRWAAVIRRRLAERYGREHRIAGERVWSFEAGSLVDADPDELRGLQFTYRKGLSIIAVARWAVEGRLERGVLAEMDDEALIAHLTQLPGIGRWSAEWFLARTLGRPVVVAGDLGVRKAVGRAYLDGRMPSELEVRALTAHWGSAAGVAQQLLLHALNAP